MAATAAGNKRVRKFADIRPSIQKRFNQYMAESKWCNVPKLTPGLAKLWVQQMSLWTRSAFKVRGHVYANCPHPLLRQKLLEVLGEEDVKDPRVGMKIVGGSSLKATSLKELLEDARANPGKIAYGHSGIGTMHHLAMEIFKQRAGIDLSAVAYKGGAQSVQDAASGQIPLAISGLVTTDGLIKAGRLRPIAVTSKGRFPSHPEVPALSEIVPGFEAAIWVGIWAPAGTPRDVLAALNGAASKALQSPEVTKKFDDIGLEPLPRTLDEIHQQWQGELAFWPEQIRKMRITLD